MKTIIQEYEKERLEIIIVRFTQFHIYEARSYIFI